MRRGGVGMLALVLVFAWCSCAAALENRCSACKAVAWELETALANEKPKNHLDMRHRLNSEGVREGKLIAYKVSELRVLELLDGLCSNMKHYKLNQTESGKEWLRVGELDIAGTDPAVTKAQGKELHTWCDRLLEEVEDKLSEAIRSSKVEGAVESLLCEDLTRNCRKNGKEAADEKGARTNAEL